MKLSITGSDLMGHLHPLRTITRQSEERDFDRISLAIHDEDDRKYLLASVNQPTYAIQMRLNLSGAVTDGEQPSVGNEPIDASAIACTKDERWVFSYSALNARNRSVGQLQADYIVTGDTLDILVGTDQSMHLAGCHVAQALEFVDYESMTKYIGSMDAEGTFTANVLQRPLSTALKVCRLGGKSAGISNQVVHLCIADNELTVEAFSSTAEYSCWINDGILPGQHLKDDNYSHFSISRDAAQVLMEVAARIGTEMRWMYSETNNILFVWCGPYMMRIDTQTLNTGTCLELDECTSGVRIGTKDLRAVLGRAKTLASKVLQMVCYPTGCVEVESSDGSVRARLVSSIYKAFKTDHTFRLPISALLALVQDVKAGEIIMTFDDTQGVCLSTDEGCVATVQSL